MKKKKGIYRILSFMFCAMFLLFAGCDATGGGGGGNGDSIAVLDGTKVLSRPSGYSFAEAVGEYSENYYNLFAAKILEKLYSAYEIETFDEEVLDNAEGKIENFIPLEGENTYGKFSGNERYYLFDTLRYTITQVDRIYAKDSDTTLTKQIVYLDFDKSWNWAIEDDATGNDVFFKTISSAFVKSETNETATVEFSGASWTDIYNREYMDSSVAYPDFKDSYIDVEVPKLDSTMPGVIDYYTSPYYQKVVEEKPEAEVTAKNFFQDALEYATYMFVLGYDYHTYDENGGLIVGAINQAEDPYFSFKIAYTNGYVSGMTVDAVPGLGNNVAVVDALDFVKNRYQEIGGYVGIVEKNIGQITRFVLEKIIGSQSPDVVTVDLIDLVDDGNGGANPKLTQPDDLVFNRNYNAIVNNIVRYACNEAPIGYSLADDGVTVVPLSLSNGFSASMITEYKNNYFFANYDTIVGGVHVSDDSEIFKNIDAAEYQSLVIYPGEDLIGKNLGDLWLDFEYFENNDPTKTMLDELNINVGFRYFDHKQNKIIVDKQEKMTIKRGKNGTLRDENNEDISDQSMFLIGEGDGPYQVSLEEGSVEFREFNNAIGGGVLDPFVSGTDIELDPTNPSSFRASKYLSGFDDARKYYKLNDSKTSGQYGTLNEAMFAGADGCSFIEIYFDIDKDPSKSGISYDFKVCFRTVTEHQDPNSMPDIGDDDFDEGDF